MSKILIGVIFIMALGGYFLYNKNIELQRLNTAYEVRDAEQKAAIEEITARMETTQRALTGLQTKNQQYETEMSNYLDIFRRHNIAQLASAKPGMIEKRANAKTKEVFDAIENDSKRISTLND
tara:strand:+ start:2484 stop:2852 length:369 start_codon:yes stop_codon:yes gene_type:complete